MSSVGWERIRPKERPQPLLNPHKGCATFQRFNGDPLYEGLQWSESGPTEFPARKHAGVTPGYLPCTVAYCRWFWDLLEPREGVRDWRMVESALTTAEERGQTLQVRLMPHGSHAQPTLPAWYRERYPTHEAVPHQGSPPCNVPYLSTRTSGAGSCGLPTKALTPTAGSCWVPSTSRGVGK